MTPRTKSSKVSVLQASSENPDQPGGSHNENAKWTPEDERAFVGFLTDHVAERGDGNYKMTTFNAAAAYLEQRRTAGGPKTGQTCKNKWARLKEIHGVCYKLKNNLGTSGFTWSEERGADIGIDDEAVWEAYVKKNPKAAQFKHKGWPLYQAVDNIATKRRANTFLLHLRHQPQTHPITEGDLDTLPDVSEGDAPQDPVDSMEDLDSTDCSKKLGTASYSPPPPPPAPSSGRKRSALEMSGSSSRATTPFASQPASQRLPRETAISRSIDRMSEVLANLVAPEVSQVDTSLESTPKRRRVAVELAAQQEEDDLSDNDMVELIEVMRRDISAVDTYLSLSRTSDRLRRAWVHRVVAERYS